MRVDKYIQSAIDYLRAGDLRQAENIFRKVLKLQKNNPAAVHFLCIISFQLKNYDSAIRYGREAVKNDPKDADAWFTLGNAYRETGDFDKAISSYQKVLGLNSRLVDVHYNLGTIFQDQKRFDEAIACYREALRLNPRDIDACYNLGLTFYQQGRPDEALSCYQKALQINPGLAEVLNNIGDIMQERGQADEALSCFQKALQINPGLSDALNNTGNILREKGRLDEAVRYFKKALQINPDFDMALANLGTTFYHKGDLDSAIECFHRALALNPTQAVANVGMSFIMLKQGNFSEGWKSYEWRWKTKEKNLRPYDIPLPEWDGSPLAGKTIFVYGEQGIGDEIMFASCLPDLIARAGLCIVVCEKRLVPIFARSFQGCKVIEHFEPRDVYPSVLPPADCKAAIGSLPGFLRPDLPAFAKRKAYLVADPGRVELWHERYSMLGKDSLKVGISWQGGGRPYDRLSRSTVLEQWAGLFPLKGVDYINLQYGDCKEALARAKETLGVTIHDWADADPLTDLENFAAQIAALDLVISVDNSTVHMAGALGVPVCALLPFAGDWRWMLRREDTPWYPSMRLFRQTVPEKWDDIFDHVYELLRKNTGSDLPIDIWSDY